MICQPESDRRKLLGERRRTMITIPEGWFAGIDIAVVIFYAVLIAKGAKKGFLYQILSFAGTVLSFFIAWRYDSVAAQYIRLWPKDWNPFADSLFADSFIDFMNEAVWFLVLFLIVRIIFHLLCSLASGLQKVPVLREVSGLLGGLLGAGIATIWILVFSVFLNTPVFANGTACADSTLIGKISEPVSETMSELGVQTNSMKALNKLFTDMNSMDDSDKQAVAKWLESHGYEKLEEGIQISLPSDGDRNESAGEQS